MHARSFKPCALQNHDAALWSPQAPSKLGFISSQGQVPQKPIPRAAAEEDEGLDVWCDSSMKKLGAAHSTCSWEMTCEECWHSHS